MTTSREVKAIKKRHLAQREQLWPGCEPLLWNRTIHDGFTTIPKTMPNIQQIMDDLSNGKPLSAVYMGLWCATWDNSVANVSKQQALAHAAGFTGQRAIYSWTGRVKLLHALRFIDVKAGSSGPVSQVLIYNPHRVIRGHYENGTPGMVEANYNALLERALEVGADDMLMSQSVASAAPQAPTGSPFAVPVSEVEMA